MWVSASLVQAYPSSECLIRIWLFGIRHPGGLSFEYSHHQLGFEEAASRSSTCVTEIMTASEAVREALHPHGLFSDHGVDCEAPTHVSVDNQSSIAVAYNPSHHGRMKHVERRH